MKDDKSPLAEFFQEDDDREWMEYAACQSLPPHMADLMFFHTKWDPHRIAREFICGRCPVQQKCLEYGARVAPADGAWGGVSETQRKINRRYNGKADATDQLIMAEG